MMLPHKKKLYFAFLAMAAFLNNKLIAETNFIFPTVFVERTQIQTRYVAKNEEDGCETEAVLSDKNTFLHIGATCDMTIEHIVNDLSWIFDKTDLDTFLGFLNVIRYQGSAPHLAIVHWKKLIDGANESPIWPIDIISYEKEHKPSGRRELVKKILIKTKFLLPLEKLFSHYRIKLRYRDRGRSFEYLPVYSREDVAKESHLLVDDIKKNYLPLKTEIYLRVEHL